MTREYVVQAHHRAATKPGGVRLLLLIAGTSLALAAPAFGDPKDKDNKPAPQPGAPQPAAPQPAAPAPAAPRGHGYIAPDSAPTTPGHHAAPSAPAPVLRTAAPQPQPAPQPAPTAPQSKPAAPATPTPTPSAPQSPPAVKPAAPQPAPQQPVPSTPRGHGYIAPDSAPFTPGHMRQSPLPQTAPPQTPVAQPPRVAAPSPQPVTRTEAPVLRNAQTDQPQRRSPHGYEAPAIPTTPGARHAAVPTHPIQAAPPAPVRLEDSLPNRTRNIESSHANAVVLEREHSRGRDSRDDRRNDFRDDHWRRHDTIVIAPRVNWYRPLSWEEPRSSCWTSYDDGWRSSFSLGLGYSSGLYNIGFTIGDSSPWNDWWGPTRRVRHETFYTPAWDACRSTELCTTTIVRPCDAWASTTYTGVWHGRSMYSANWVSWNYTMPVTTVYDAAPIVYVQPAPVVVEAPVYTPAPLVIASGPATYYRENRDMGPMDIFDTPANIMTALMTTNAAARPQTAARFLGRRPVGAWEVTFTTLRQTGMGWDAICTGALPAANGLKPTIVLHLTETPGGLVAGQSIGITGRLIELSADDPANPGGVLVMEEGLVRK